MDNCLSLYFSIDQIFEQQLKMIKQSDLINYLFV